MKPQFLAGGIVFAAVFSVAASSCLAVPKTSPDNDREIVQLAQNAYDSGNTRAAKFYYNELINKYGNYPAIYIEGKFELAHIAIKKKKYDEAVPILDEILLIYNNVAPGLLPGSYKKLAESDLAKVPEEKLENIRKKAREKALAEQQKLLEEQERLAAEDAKRLEEEMKAEQALLEQERQAELSAESVTEELSTEETAVEEIAAEESETEAE